ncbi:MAG: NADH-quinone oxidoreductase subunit K [Thioalkalivibrio sp.]|nr:MAG: NADH-quinone oxidoreductase subunit K [Thioalkalivibrio sp.]
MTVYLSLAGVLFLIGLHGFFTARNLLRRLLALNVLTTAVFLLFVVMARLAEPLDAVPHAIVLTGIVVTVSTTAVALALLVRIAGRMRDEDTDPAAGPRGGAG